jgi:hypothetical protein
VRGKARGETMQIVAKPAKFRLFRVELIRTHLAETTACDTLTMRVAGLRILRAGSAGRTCVPVP